MKKKKSFESEIFGTFDRRIIATTMSQHIFLKVECRPVNDVEDDEYDWKRNLKII
jgi:hypothetical protein